MKRRKESTYRRRRPSPRKIRELWNLIRPHLLNCLLLQNPLIRLRGYTIIQNSRKDLYVFVWTREGTRTPGIEEVFLLVGWAVEGQFVEVFAVLEVAVGVCGFWG